MGARLARIRENAGLALAVAAAIILVLAWIGWAIYVTTEDGGTEGLGVLIAWPALLAATALIALPFVGAFLLYRRLSSDQKESVGRDPQTSGGGSQPEDPAESGEAEAEPTSAG